MLWFTYIGRATQGGYIFYKKHHCEVKDQEGPSGHIRRQSKTHGIAYLSETS